MSKLEEQKALPRRKLFRSSEEIIRAGRSLGGKGNAVLVEILAGRLRVRKAKKAELVPGLLGVVAPKSKRKAKKAKGKR